MALMLVAGISDQHFGTAQGHALFVLLATRKRREIPVAIYSWLALLVDLSILLVPSNEHK